MKDINTFYTCPYCKEEYANPGDLARCILSCEDKKRVEDERVKKAKLEAEKQKRYDQIVEAYKKFENLRSEFINDYGKFAFHTECKDGDMCEWIFKTFGLI